MAIVLYVIFVLALLCWLAAMWAVLRLVGLSPGSKFMAFQDIGMWNFAKVRAAGGVEAEKYITLFKRSFLGFFVTIVMSFAAFTLGTWLWPAPPAA